MTRTRIILLVLGALLIAALPLGGMAADIDGDGVEDNSNPMVDRNNDGYDDSYHPVGIKAAGTRGGAAAPTGRDMLIIHDTDPLAYFGWYRANMMPPTGWDLFQRTIDWADGGSLPASTNVILFTYDGSLDPEASAERGGIAVFDYLFAAGYNVAQVHSQFAIESLPSSHYASFDLAIYAWGFPRNAINIVNSGIPFVTFSGGESDEMGIGTGLGGPVSFSDQFLVIDNSHHPTLPYPLGSLTFEEPMFNGSTHGAGNGIVLVAATPTPTPEPPTPTPPATPTPPTPTPTPPTPIPTPTPEPPCASLNPVTTIVTSAKGQSAANNAKVSHTITGNIIDPGSLSSTAHRIEVCTGTAISSTVTDATGKPTNTAGGSLACNATGCSGPVNVTEKYQSVSQDGRDKDRITFVPSGDPPPECPCWTEEQLDAAGQISTLECVVQPDHAFMTAFSGGEFPEIYDVLDAEETRCVRISFLQSVFLDLLISVADFFVCHDSLEAECISRGFPVP